MKIWKRHMTEELDQPNQEKINMLREKETYKYFIILGAGTIKQVQMKEKKKEYFWRRRKLLETKL